MKRLLFAVLLGAVAIAAQQPPPAPPQPPAPGPVPAESESKPGTYVGVASCANSGCHGATEPLQAARIRQNEYYTWLHSDRHAGAYNVLFNAVSARVARNMHLSKKAYQEKICLDCHSTNVPASTVSGHIDLEDGVQCEACHGPAGGWRGEHAQAGWTHAQSVERGMIDLRDTRIRAHGCNHCHVGAQEKEVDHDLIASGHPLLAFELDNYTETMPAHWNPNETHGVPAWAVGQAMAFRDSMGNLARHARGEKWPEFSDMSCTNCHHSLKGGLWRQERGWTGRPGLPAWSPQRWAALPMILAKAAPSARQPLEEQLALVATRVSRMNDASGIAAAADEARRTIETAIPRIAAASWSADDVGPIMLALTSRREFILRSDVASAEQLALSLQTLATVLTRRDPRLAAGPMMKAIDALFVEVRDREAYDPNRFVEKLDALRSTL